MAEILFAIGDIHGCKKELDVIHNKIKKILFKKIIKNQLSLILVII